MLFQLHGAMANYSMVMVRNGYGYGIEVFVFLFKHFAPVVVKFSFGKLFLTLHAGALVNIAQKSYFSIFLWRGGKMVDVIFSFASCTDGRYIQLITWRGKSFAAQHKAGHNIKSCCRDG